jgi:hypothetical protein
VVGHRVAVATIAVPRTEGGVARPDVAQAQRLATAHLPAVLHYASLLLAYPLLLWLGRNTWFRHDEWRIIAGHTGAGSQPWDIFAPLDVHWSTAVVLFYRGVGAVAGASSYLPYLALSLLVHVAAAHLLWRVLRRCGADAWVSALLVAAFLVLGAGWEALYWVLALTFTVPLATALGALLLADRDELQPRHRAGIAALTLLGVMSGGAGVALLVVPALVAARRRGVAHGVSVVMPAVAVYALWLALAGSDILNHPGSASAGMLDTVGRFVWDGMAGSMATLLGPAALGAAAFVGLLAWMVVRLARRARGGLPAPAVACAAGAVAMFLLTAMGRANGETANTSHYLYAGAALLLPAAGLAVTDLVRRLRIPRLVVVAGLGVVVAHSAALLVSQAATVTAEDQRSRDLLLAAAKLSADGTALPASVPEPQLAWAVTAADVARLRDQGVLPPPPTIGRADAAELWLRLHVEVSATPVAAAVTPPRVLAVSGGATLSPVDSATGCSTASGGGWDGFTVSVAYPGPGALRVTAVTPVALKVYLHGSLDAPADEAARLLVPNGQTWAVDDTASASTLILHVSAGTVRLCG